METRNIRLGIVLRMIAWGVASGAVLGALFPLLMVILIQLLKMLFGGDANEANGTMLSIFVGVGCIAGFIIGGCAGLVLGFIVGVVLATLTHRVLDPTVNNQWC
jgi:hypothetical protein